MNEFVDPFFGQHPMRNGHPVRRPVRRSVGHQEAARIMNNRNFNQTGRAMPEKQALLMQLEKLQQLAAEQAHLIAEQKQQLQIKSDAIQQQTEDIKRLDAERIWNQAALHQAVESQGSNKAEAGWQEKYARLQAEMDNLRKRWENRSIEKTREERNRILMDMLPLADHLELALQHSQQAQSQDIQADLQKSASSGAFMDNIRATLSAFLVTLQRYNIEPIDALGEPFDPMLHEAVGQIGSTKIPAEHVAQVLQTGYRDGEKLLRPARVLVSNG